MRASGRKRILALLGIVAALIAVMLGWWTLGTRRADATALAAAADEDGTSDGITVHELEDGSLAFIPESPVAGIVFYPGAQVQPEAYAPLLTSCAREGFAVILVRPPLDMPLFSIDAADGAVEEFPQVTEWYLAGHSLGGVAACEHLASHMDGYAGIVLLAAYPNTDISAYDGEVLLLVGTEDGIISRERLASSQDYLPSTAQLLALEDGNHAQFGNYGAQDGDGTAAITWEEQQEETVAAIVGMSLQR